MDEVIFEEFKGTGKPEVVLSRNAAKKGFYPALDIKSGTRKKKRIFRYNIKKHEDFKNAISKWMKLKH